MTFTVQVVDSGYSRIDNAGESFIELGNIWALKDGVKGDLGQRIRCEFWPEATLQTMGFVIEVGRVISHGVSKVWANGAKRNRPICKRSGRYASSPGAFEGSKVPCGIEDWSKIDDCEAVRWRWDEQAVAPEAVGGGIEERRGWKISTVQEPIPVPVVRPLFKKFKAVFSRELTAVSPRSHTHLEGPFQMSV